MSNVFRRCRNAVLLSYRRLSPSTANPDTGRPAPEPRPHTGSSVPGRPANQLPGWASWPTVAEPRPGRAGWLTPAQTWRANGGRW